MLGSAAACAATLNVAWLPSSPEACTIAAPGCATPLDSTTGSIDGRFTDVSVESDNLAEWNCQVRPAGPAVSLAGVGPRLFAVQRATDVSNPGARLVH